MVKISEDKISEIRNSVNIVHYIAQFVQLKKAGQNYKGLCPFHTEKTPSFVVSPAKQIFHCFGCGKGGNIFTFISDYEKLSFIEAVRKAADFAGIILPQAEPEKTSTDYIQRLYSINQTAADFFEENLYLAVNKSKLNYFTERKLSPETIKKFKLGYAPDSYDKLLLTLKKANHDLNESEKLGLIAKKESSSDFYDKFRNRVIFPFHNLSGKICGFGGRKLQEAQQPKYLNSPENPIYSKGQLLYGLHQAVNAIRDEGFVFLVEGYFDLLRLIESGIRNVVASSGTALTPDQVKLLRRYTSNVYITFDGDEAGKKAAARNAVIIEKQDMNSFILPTPAGEDPDTLIINKGLKTFNLLIKNKKQLVEFQIDEFLSVNNHPGIDEKELFVQEILNTIVEIKNQVKIGLYIHLLSDRLQINEGMLISQLNRIKKSLLRYPGSLSNAQAQEKKNPDPKIKTGQYKAERGIINLLMSGNKEVYNYLNQHIRHDLFENDLFIRIYEQIIHEYEETGTIDAQIIFQNFQEDEQITQELSEIMIEEQADPMKFARDCLFILRKWKLEKRANEITLLMKEEIDSRESALFYTQELMHIRKEVAQLDKEFRRK
ncbi:MAG: DNA primase [Calditrichaceae bacterium]|nr:DNA primase [Calditrichaceae bacterium]MBN2708243.1 DNA primase [Calditrichaceae bacterium]RQV92265.1 MAG: DNA primase [Calditrichota bacterium]